MNHDLEKQGLQVLIPFLEAQGHFVERMTGTFDLRVDGKAAEVKTKGKEFNKFDFISLTQKQYSAMGEQEFDIYLVCNLNNEKPEIYKINSKSLFGFQPRIITSYEYDRPRLKDAWENLFPGDSETLGGLSKAS